MSGAPNQSLKHPNAYVYELIAASTSSMSLDKQPFEGQVRTELDSHANMVVLGSNVLILNTTMRTAKVKPFSPDYKALPDVPIVDAALLYMCGYTGDKCILICFNALSIPTM